ncbi:hypothetical protein [Mesorhizobium sp.]|uniref:hypothetical protein n=1 Tax=Mesorhizobium sp. TaxID=1871066 RepID=UPI0025C6141F|nr:hypothetical protein [Mesorhizobium sp.]
MKRLLAIPTENRSLTLAILMLKGVQEFKKPVVWPKWFGLCAFVWLQLGKCGFLQLKVCVKTGTASFPSLHQD